MVKKESLIPTNLILLLILITVSACGMSNVSELCTVTMNKAQTMYIHDGYIYFPDGDALKCIDRTGKEKIIYRDSDLGIFMGFGTNIKTIDTFSHIIILDGTNIVLNKIPAKFPGQTFVSKNDEYIVSLNIMESIFRMYDRNGTVLRDFEEIAYEVDISDDGTLMISNAGYLYNIHSGEVRATEDYSSFEFVRIVNDGIFVIDDKEIDELNKGYCAVYGFDMAEQWNKVYPIQPLCSFNSSSVIIYSRNQVQYVNLSTGNISWEKSYSTQILRNWKSPMYDSEYCVFQTSDNKIHVLDKTGKELFIKDIGKVNKIAVGGNLIVYRTSDTKNYTILEIAEGK